MRYTHLISFLIFTVFLAGGVYPSLAGPYVPSRNLEIETEFLQDLPTRKGEAAPTKISWLVSPAAADEQSVSLQFFLNRQLSVPVTAVTILFAGGVTRKEQSGQTTDAPVHLLLNSGSPVPADILPIMQTEREKTYQVEEKAGGRNFLHTYRVVETEVSAPEAVKKGWLRKIPPADERLQSVTVYDDRNQLVALQVWPVGGEWWLYEETPYRRSWLVQ
ncbi:MAG: hypothetical protein HY885_06530 [Deltaproteobacteria bacterium]|nr:hypothetical protein [Deltaproteobacteria bacterium]